MTRYTLHVPLKDNEGGPIDGVHRAVRCALARLTDSGGYSTLRAHGVWRGVMEPVRLYIIDVPDEDAEVARRDLQKLARRVKADAQQAAVYLTERRITVHLI